MTLWTIIRDYFVQHIFGGTLSDGTIINNNNGLVGDGLLSVGNNTISLGDWLSTTATIVMLIMLLIMLLSLVRFVIRQVSGLFAKI